MAHPGIAILEALIAEEQANLVALDEEREALMAAHAPGSQLDDMKFYANITDCIARRRNSNLTIKFAKIQIAALADQ